MLHAATGSCINASDQCPGMGPASRWQLLSMVTQPQWWVAHLLIPCYCDIPRTIYQLSILNECPHTYSILDMHMHMHAYA